MHLDIRSIILINCIEVSAYKLNNIIYSMNYTNENWKL